MHRTLGALLALIALAPALGQETPYRTPPDRPIDVTAIHLDLDVDLEQKRVAAQARLDLTAIQPAHRFVTMPMNS